MERTKLEKLQNEAIYGSLTKGYAGDKMLWVRVQLVIKGVLKNMVG